MTKAVPRSVVQGFYDAYALRDPALIAPFLDRDVEWTIGGPIDLLHFCGFRRGKAAVLDLFTRVIPDVFATISFSADNILVDGDRAAMLCRISATQRGSGRAISYRCAQFVQFRANKVVAFHSVIDSFDAAEQVLGRPIALNEGLDQPGVQVDEMFELVSQ